MRQKIAALALAAVMALGLSGCASGNNAERDYSTTGPNEEITGADSNINRSTGGSTNGTTNSVTNGTNGAMINGANGGMTNGTNGTNNTNGTAGTRGNLGDGDNNGIAGGTDRDRNDTPLADAGDELFDMLDGDDDGALGRSYEDMLANGRVHDSDGYLLDGENAQR